MNNKENRILFNNTYQSLEKENRFDRKLENSLKFLKIIGKELEDYRLDKILHVAVR